MTKMNFLKIGYLLILVLVTQANLYSQETYSQGLFETDEVFSQRVKSNFRPQIDYIAKCEIISAIFDLNTFKEEPGLDFVVKPTKFRVTGDLDFDGWPDVIVKIISKETKTVIFTEDIEINVTHFQIYSDNTTMDIKFTMPFSLEKKKSMWESIANEEIIIQFLYKSEIIEQFKIGSILSIIESAENKKYSFYPERY